MKIISIFIPTLRPGGAEKQASILASLLSREFHVNLIVFYGEIEVDARNLEYLKESSVKIDKLTGSFFNKVKILSGILKDTDVLFNYLTFCDFLGGIVAKFHKVDKIYSGVRCSDLPLWKIVLERVGAKASAGVIFNSSFGCRELGNRIVRKDKQLVIPNCVPICPKFQARPDKKVKTIVTVARFVPQKDFDTALKSIKALLSVRSDFNYVIVGYGELEDEIRRTISANNLEEQVKIVIKPNNVADYLHNADIYLSTSVFEGTSNSILEAMADGLPIVATSVGDAPYMISDNNGFLLNPGDSLRITDALSQLLSSVEMRTRMGRASNGIVQDRFSTNSFLTAYYKLIN